MCGFQLILAKLLSSDLQSSTVKPDGNGLVLQTTPHTRPTLPVGILKIISHYIVHNVSSVDLHRPVVANLLLGFRSGYIHCPQNHRHPSSTSSHSS